MPQGLLTFRLQPGTSIRGMEIAQRLRSGLSQNAGKAVAGAMRDGRGGIADQFRRQAEALQRGGYNPWPPTKPFGTRQPGPQTLVRTGRLRGAWLGGSGSTTAVAAHRVAVGVDGRAFPQAGMFMADAPTIVKPRKAGRPPRSAMGWKLGMSFGVWISEARLARGLSIPPRRLGIGPEMLRSVRGVVTRYFIDGDSGLRGAE